MGKRGRFLVGSVLIAGAVGYLVYTAVTETSVYYLTIGEFWQKKEQVADTGLRLAGRVQPGSVSYDAKSMGLEFALVDIEKPAAPLKVSYRGVLPDMFAEGRDVIVEGRYSDGTFEAHKVLTSCPSKYEPDEPSQGRKYETDEPARGQVSAR
ncbi:MAG: cytochrome C biogenesis protein CcmE [Candidatus Binatia bacterium]|nr:MAG: cytochrome C biogenesis protein CcmE [Candidatus Binatia bacterium]